MRDCGASGIKPQSLKPAGGFARRHAADLLNGLAFPADVAGDFIEARAAAVGTDDFGFVFRPGELRFHRLALLHGLADGGRQHAVARTGRTGPGFGVV